MAWIFGIIALCVGALVLVIVAWLGGQIVPPIYDIVIANSAVKAMGFDTGVEVAMRIGLTYALPLLALSIIVWFLLLRLRRDAYQGRRPR